MRVRLIVPFFAAGILLFLFLLIQFRPNSSAFRGDYGDAPDGMLGMDTGYYGFTAVMGGAAPVFVLAPLGVPADFPTQQSNKGPFMNDVDDFYIGPLLPSFDPPRPEDVPSLGDDAIDETNDDDGLPNIDPPSMPGKADCDDENFEHDPAAAGCDPVPVFSIPRNAQLILLASGVPPVALFLSSIAAATGTPVQTAYWNVAFDLNQDGAWGADEWVAQDVPVALTPGTNHLVVTPAFRWGTAGDGFGRLRFPVWTRNMATEVTVRDNVALQGQAPYQYWDGRGKPGGFERGEVEDYFVEWRPRGQMLESPAAEDTAYADPADSSAADQAAQLVHFACPDVVRPGQTITCELSGPPVETITAVIVADPENGGPVAAEARLTTEVSEGSLQADGLAVTLVHEGNLLAMTVDEATPGSAVIFAGELANAANEHGNSAVAVTGGAMILMGR